LTHIIFKTNMADYQTTVI